MKQKQSSLQLKLSQCRGTLQKVRRSKQVCLKIVTKFVSITTGSESIEKPYLNSLLNSHLAGALCDTVKKYDILFKDEHEWDMDKVLASKTIKEFDSHFTSIHFGYGNVDTYYKNATLHNKLHNIKVPTLCLSAADDPFQPLEGENCTFT